MDMAQAQALRRWEPEPEPISEPDPELDTCPSEIRRLHAAIEHWGAQEPSCSIIVYI